MKNLNKTVVLAVVLSFVMAPYVHAAENGPNARLSPPSPTLAVKPGIEHTPIVLNGLPVVKNFVSSSANPSPGVTYQGSKEIPFVVKTAGVITTVESGNQGLEARFRGSHITVENKGLVPGDTAEIVISLYSHPAGTIKKTMLVKITDGSKENPHIVADVADLLSIKSLGLNKSYTQTTDIDLSGINKWSPIGDEIDPFKGIYNGGGYTVKDMSFVEVLTDYPALFGVVAGESAAIENLNVTGKINTQAYAVHNYGTIAGKLDGGKISNCSFKGDIILGKNTGVVGGITALAMNKAVISNCTYEGKIESRADNSIIGCIAGSSFASITGCQAKGEIMSEGVKSVAGGITGRNYGRIENAKSAVNIGRYGADGKAGGITGYNYIAVVNSAYDGKLHSKGNNAQTGGIAALNSGAIQGSTTSGSLTFDGEDNMLGGIAGQNNDGTIENSSSAMTISGAGKTVYAGGIAGENYSRVDEAQGKMTREIVSAIRNCVYSGDVAIRGENSFAGGIAGRNYGVMVTLSSVPEAAISVIENCAVVGKSVSGANAGRITAQNRLDGLGQFSDRVLPVILVNNAAIQSMSVNEKVLADSDKNGINGSGMSEADINKFIKDSGK